jgi:hypothetical protein
LLGLEVVGALNTPLEQIGPATTRRVEPVPEHTRRYAAAAARQHHLYDALVV